MLKNISFGIILFLGIIVFQTCNEPFSPNAGFQKKYSLNCIVMADTNLQVATVFNSSPVDSNNVNHDINTDFVQNAFIRLWRGNDEIFVFKNKSNDTSNVGLLRNYYYTTGLILQPADKLEIEALMPDGNRLKSETVVPSFVELDYTRASVRIPPEFTKDVIFAWIPKGKNLIYISSLEIIYKQKVGDIRILKRVKVPWKYVSEDGSEVELEKPPSEIPEIQFPIDNIERVLKSISEGDPNKQNYMIFSAVLELKILDRNLSAYYFSSNRIADPYSIRLDTKDFSNITGGFGVFGSFTIQKIGLRFVDNYIVKFGYVTSN